MKKILYILFITIFLIQLEACRKADREMETPGIETILQGKVYDPIRNIHIAGYRVTLAKYISGCADWTCILDIIDAGSDTTDSNGNFEIKFKYKLQAGEKYGLNNQNYLIPYHVDYTTPFNLLPGVTNNIDIHVWKPVYLQLNVQVVNNIHPPLRIAIEYSNNQILSAPEYIYDTIANKTFTMSCKPNSNHDILFRYYTGSQSQPVLHEKKFSYQTSFQDTTQAGFSVDCSTF